MNAPKIKIPSKSNPVAVAPSAPAAEGTEPTPVPVAPAAPVLSKEEKKGLFDRAFAYDETVDALVKQIDAVKAEKSVAVKAIHEAVGKGPFQYRGREITISSREGTFFFKDYGKRDLESIDA